MTGSEKEEKVAVAKQLKKFASRLTGTPANFAALSCGASPPLLYLSTACLPRAPFFNLDRSYSRRVRRLISVFQFSSS